MKKPLYTILAVAALGVTVWFAGPRVLGSAIPIPEGAPFTTGSLSVNPFSGTARLSDVTLLSQSPYQAPYVVQVPEISARFDASTLMSSFVVVEEVVVRGADLHIEQRGRNVNVQDVMQWVNAYLADADTTSLPRVFVREFHFEGARGTMHTDLGTREFAVRDVVLRDLGSPTSGTPVQVLAANVLEPILMEAIAEAGLPGRVRERVRRMLRP